MLKISGSIITICNFVINRKLLFMENFTFLEIFHFRTLTQTNQQPPFHLRNFTSLLMMFLATSSYETIHILFAVVQSMHPYNDTSLILISIVRRVETRQIRPFSNVFSKFRPTSAKLGGETY